MVYLRLEIHIKVDNKFLMRRYTESLDLQFKSYEVFKISSEVRACYQPLSMQENLPKTAQNCQDLLKDN
jgi:hypothetical protein